MYHCHEAFSSFAFQSWAQAGSSACRWGGAPRTPPGFPATPRRWRDGRSLCHCCTSAFGLSCMHAGLQINTLSRAFDLGCQKSPYSSNGSSPKPLQTPSCRNVGAGCGPQARSHGPPCFGDSSAGPFGDQNKRNNQTLAPKDNKHRVDWSTQGMLTSVERGKTFMHDCPKLPNAQNQPFQLYTPPDHGEILK